MNSTAGGPAPQAPGSRPGRAAPAHAADLELGVSLEDAGDIQGALDAYRRAVDSGDADVAPRASVRLGDVLASQDPKAAEAAYRGAIDSGHPDAAASAAASLGILFEEQGDVAGAKLASGRAVDSGQRRWAALAGW
jgi:tetratricopeptide (TPR) repeat protein